MTVYLHIQNSHLSLSFNDFWPHMSVSFHILGNQLLIIYKL